jgi:hypothetical protein
MAFLFQKFFWVWQIVWVDSLHYSNLVSNLKPFECCNKKLQMHIQRGFKVYMIFQIFFVFKLWFFLGVSKIYEFVSLDKSNISISSYLDFIIINYKCILKKWLRFIRVAKFCHFKPWYHFKKIIIFDSTTCISCFISLQRTCMRHLDCTRVLTPKRSRLHIIRYNTHMDTHIP